jgi:protein-L-isoaspartate(D-aspartate) O-methyltransferase
VSLHRQTRRRLVPLAWVLLCSLAGCDAGANHGSAARPTGASSPTAAPDAIQREEMVRQQLEARDIQDERVLAAMREVPRHLFLPEPLQEAAYEDRPLPIGYDVTISQPYIVALMTELAQIDPGDRVLDVGTGSGYQAAVLAQMGARVFGIEIIEPLAEQAAERLEQLGYDAVEVRTGDGFAGWPERGPFDAIIVAAAPARIPPPLTRQLTIGGKLVIPVGADPWQQQLRVVTRTRTGLQEKTITPVAFVPMTGRAQEGG